MTKEDVLSRIRNVKRSINGEIKANICINGIQQLSFLKENKDKFDYRLPSGETGTITHLEIVDIFNIL